MFSMIRHFASSGLRSIHADPRRPGMKQARRSPQATSRFPLGDDHIATQLQPAINRQFIDQAIGDVHRTLEAYPDNTLPIYALMREHHTKLCRERDAMASIHETPTRPS